MELRLYILNCSAYPKDWDGRNTSFLVNPDKRTIKHLGHWPIQGIIEFANAIDCQIINLTDVNSNELIKILSAENLTLEK